MKKIIIFLLLTIATIGVQAQEFVAPTKGHSVAFIDTTTTYTYKMPEKTYKVYKSKKGAFYIWKESKRTGKPYKYYLPKEVQIQMGRKYDSFTFSVK